MAKMKFANNANTTLASSLTAIATSMSVVSSSLFPTLNPVAPIPEYFYCTLTDVATNTRIEIVKVTAISGTTWTITRGQDGTTGAIFAAGDVVSLRLVKASLDNFPKLDEVNTFTSVQTFSSQPILSSLTASSAVATDASKGLVSVTNTGSGNNVLATSPTITGATLTTAALNGTLGATTPSTVAATTITCTDLTTTGNTILGNASTDTLNVGNGGIVKDANGRVTMSGQPTFTYTQSTENNVTGDGTVYQMTFGSQISEQGGSNVTGGVFTAPVAGKYLLSFCVFVNNTGAAHTYKNVQLVTTLKTFRCTTSLIAANIWDTETFTLTVVAEMAAGDTAYVTTAVSGSTKTVGILGPNSGYNTFFSGHLVC